MFKPRTPEQALGVARAPALPPNQAPYKPGRSPAQVATKRVNVQHAASVVPQNPVDPLVVSIQQHLKQLGYGVDADGILGPVTRAAMAASQNGTIPNAVHHPDHARRQAEQQVARQQVGEIVKSERAKQRSKLPSYPITPGDIQADPSLRDAALNHGRLVPQPDGSRKVEYPQTPYVNEENAQAAAFRMKEQGKLGFLLRETLQGLVPHRVTAAIGAGQTPSAGDIASDVFNGALWITPGAVAPALRTVRVASEAFRTEGITANALRTIREAQGAIRVASEDAASLKRVMSAARKAQKAEGSIVSPVRDQISAAIDQAPMIDKKQARALMETNDVGARAVAQQLGTTPDRAYELMWKGAQFHDYSPTAAELRSGSLAQTGGGFEHVGKDSEITNLSQTPEVFKVNQEYLDRSARNLPRTNRAGAPPQATTTKGIRTLLTDLQNRAIEAADYRKWYANSAAGILTHTSNNVQEADKLAALIAVYSPRAEVYSKKTDWNNLDRAIVAYDEYIATGKVTEASSMSKTPTRKFLEKGGTPEEWAALRDHQTIRANNIVNGDFTWDGLKTNRFYRNFLQHIDPAKYESLFGAEKFGTMDTWMRRAFKYPVTQKTEERTTLFGIEHIPVGKKQETITPQMYAFMEKANKAVGDSLGWSPDEVRAAIWTSVKAEAEGTPLSQAGFDFRDAFAHRAAKRARPLAPEQLSLAATTADTARVDVVDAAIEASREPSSGFTLTIGLNPDTATSGFYASHGAYEFKMGAPLSRKGLLDFRNKHLALLKSDPALRVGGWNQDGTVFLDISQRFATQEEAMQFGRAQGQEAIFDLSTFTEIPTGLSAAEADAIKAGLREQGVLDEQVVKYDDMLTRAYELLTGKPVKELPSGAAKDAESYIFDWVDKHPDAPEAQMFRDLYRDSETARLTREDPNLLFQEDPLVRAIADAHGLKLSKQDELAMAERKLTSEVGKSDAAWQAGRDAELRKARQDRLGPDYAGLFTQASPTVKGAVMPAEDGSYFLHLFQTADTSTVLHELAHALAPFVPEADRALLVKLGLDHPEKFARAFERYFYEGVAPTKSLRKTFHTLARGMAEVYDHAGAIPGSTFSPEIKAAFDGFFSREAAIDSRWTARAGTSRSLFQVGDVPPPGDPRLEAAAMQIDQGGKSVQEAADMLGLDPMDVQAYLDEGTHATEQSRILSNADVGGGPAETTRSARDILDNPTIRTPHPAPAPEGDPIALAEAMTATPEARVRKGIRGARAGYSAQKIQRREELQRRARKVDEALRTIADPDEAMSVASAAMRGELPAIDFQGFKTLDAAALRHLKSYVNHHDELLPFQKLRLNIALDRATNEGHMPTPSELRLIESVFGKQTALGIAARAAWGDKLINALNIPRTLMATADLSAVGRQALVAGASHPIIWGRSWPVMIRSMRSGEFYTAAMNDVKSHPLYNMALAGGVSFTDVGEKASILAHEEAFASDYAARLPGIGAVIKGSARAYTGFLNKLRMDLFANHIRAAIAAGRDVSDEKLLKSLGDVVNGATGRGTIHGRAEHILPALNTLMFSPRLMLSRINYLDPTWYVRLHPAARKEALRGLFATVGAVTSTLFLASKIPGVGVGSLDPRSSDFGKLRWGDTRIDFAGGFQQYIRLVAELATNSSVSSLTGETTKFGTGFGDKSRLEVIQNFLYNKAAPPVAIAIGALRKVDAVGNPVTPQSVALNNFTPLLFQDAKDIYNEKHGGVDGIAWALGAYGLGSFGVGEQTYSAKDPAKAPTDKLTAAAKAAGIPAPTHEILLALDHKAGLDHISSRHPNDPQGALKDAVAYYSKTTGKSDFDRLLSGTLPDETARQMIGIIREVLVGPGLSAYEGAVKTAAEAKGVK